MNCGSVKFATSKPKRKNGPKELIWHDPRHVNSKCGRCGGRGHTAKDHDGVKDTRLTSVVCSKCTGRGHRSESHPPEDDWTARRNQETFNKKFGKLFKSNKKKKQKQRRKNWQWRSQPTCSKDIEYKVIDGQVIAFLNRLEEDRLIERESENMPYWQENQVTSNMRNQPIWPILEHQCT